MKIYEPMKKEDSRVSVTISERIKGQPRKAKSFTVIGSDLETIYKICKNCIEEYNT